MQRGCKRLHRIVVAGRNDHRSLDTVDSDHKLVVGVVDRKVVGHIDGRRATVGHCGGRLDTAQCGGRGTHLRILEAKQFFAQGGGVGTGGLVQRHLDTGCITGCARLHSEGLVARVIGHAHAKALLIGRTDHGAIGDDLQAVGAVISHLDRGAAQAEHLVATGAALSDAHGSGAVGKLESACVVIAGDRQGVGASGHAAFEVQVAVHRVLHGDPHLPSGHLGPVYGRIGQAKVCGGQRDADGLGGACGIHDTAGAHRQLSVGWRAEVEVRLVTKGAIEVVGDFLGDLVAGHLHIDVGQITQVHRHRVVCAVDIDGKHLRQQRLVVGRCVGPFLEVNAVGQVKLLGINRLGAGDGGRLGWAHIGEFVQ